MNNSSGWRRATSPLSTEQAEAQAVAIAELEIRRRKALRDRVDARERLVDLDLLDFIPALTPRIGPSPTERPDHLEPLGKVFDRIEAGERDVRVLVSLPPQYGKTETIAHGIARKLAKSPSWPLIFASYSDDLADSKSRIIRDYARAAGLELRPDADAVGTWLTPQGGGLRARGILAGISGEPAMGLVVDDPHKNRAEAESALVRQRIYDEFTGVLAPRVHPGGFILVCHTRWNDDDLIARLSKQKKPDGSPLYEVINLPAILPSGRPLWHRRPLEFLAQHRALDEYNWQSQWMGQPRGRGDAVFKDVRFFDRMPLRYSVGKGLDLAYAGKKSSHFSCGVTLLGDSDERDDKLRRYYVVDVRRRQLEVREFTKLLAQNDWRGAWHWFTSTTERGVAQLMTELGVDVDDVLATQDKFARAQPFAAAWNDGRVLVPRDMRSLLGDVPAAYDASGKPREVPWLRDFTDEVCAFTGVSDAFDDQVDASASAFEGVRYSGGGVVKIAPDPSARWAEDVRGYG